METRSLLEFYDGEKLLIRLSSAMVPPIGYYISIKKVTWLVVGVTYAIDYAENSQNERIMRANIDLQEVR